MSTSNVVVSRSGTGYTIDVTACDLLDDLTIKDFVVLHNGTPYSLLNNYSKTTRTTLTYTGPSLGTTTVEVRRKTPPTVIRSINFGERMSSDLWNKELDRTTRWKEEADLNGVGAAFSGSLPVPQSEAFGVNWSADTVFPPSRKAVYDLAVTLAPIASPTFTGDPKAPTPVTTDNDTSIATTAYVKNNLANYATTASPSLSGTPTTPTPTLNSNNTQVANMAALFAAARSTPAGNGNIGIGNVLVQWGSSVITTNAAGAVTVTFAVPFSSAAYTVLLCNGDAAATNSSMAYLGALSTTTFGVQTTPSVVGVPVRVNWVAIGPV